MGFLIRVAFAALCGLLISLQSLAPTHTVTPSAQNHVLAGNALYYEGRPSEALAAYARAVKTDSRSLNARLNGAVVLNDLGEHATAAIWYREAARLAPHDIEIRTALTETLRTSGQPDDAREEINRALSAAPDDVHALTTLGRIELDDGDPAAAARALAKATTLDPNFTLAHFYLGQARERLGDDAGALDAYKLATFHDSYFTTARFHMSRALYRLKRFHEASDQTTKLVAAAPIHAQYRKLEHALSSRLRRPPRNGERPAETPKTRSAHHPAPLLPPPTGEVPRLKVGIGTDGMGKPLPWHGFHFTPKTQFRIVSAYSGAPITQGKAGGKWKAVAAPKRYLEIYDPAGKRMVRTRGALRIQPDTSKGGWTYFKELPGHGRGLARTLRGELEVSLFPGKSALQVVNLVDLESYTQGVLTAEMPIDSPREALKAQAVIARTHALFVKGARPRHTRDGYDICDGQHCQVYYGVGSETEKSREVVESTRGRIVTHQGRAAEMLYSSNCGGHGQSSGDLKGWSDVSYFSGDRDADETVEVPASPWSLRHWLRSKPKTYCRPSPYVYASHYRWTRVIPAQDLEKRINRSVPIGQLLGIVPHKRSASGHLNSILVRGSRGNRVIDTEMRIRGLFGIGSQRSALFVMDTEYDAAARPKNFIFYGGGWGHGVGMCQSGAMGRAENGQSYARILKSYYKGVEIGNLRY